MSHTLTRRQLFDLVWSKPMTKVAADLGISDVAVKKICDKHRILAPGRGYWAKVAAEQRLRPATFREISDPLLNRIHILGNPLSRLPQEVLAKRVSAQLTIQAAPTSTSDNRIAGADALHPLAERHQAALRSAEAGSDQMIRLRSINLLHCTLTTASIGRAVFLIDCLAREIDKCGIRLEPGENDMVVTADGVAIRMTLTEGSDKVQHELTDAEIDALEKSRLNGEGWSFRSLKRAIPKFDCVPNGRLSLKIDQGDYHSDGIRREFADGSRQRIETKVPDIVAGLLTCAAVHKAAREAREQAQREWTAQEARRQETALRETLEAKRVEFLKLQMELANEAQAVEAFVASYLARYAESLETPSCSAFIRWAQDYSAQLRASVEPSRLGRSWLNMR